MDGRCGLDLSDSGMGPVEGECEYSNRTVGYNREGAELLNFLFCAIMVYSLLLN